MRLQAKLCFARSAATLAKHFMVLFEKDCCIAFSAFAAKFGFICACSEVFAGRGPQSGGGQPRAGAPGTVHQQEL